MTVSENTVAGTRRQYVAYGAIVAALSVLLAFTDGAVYRRFTGNVSPLGTYLAAAVLGAAVLYCMLKRRWFSILKRGGPAERWRVPALAFVFGVIIAVADWVIVFPEGMNVPFPRSLIFYPVIGFIVEVFFHLLPLGLLLYVISKTFGVTRAAGSRGFSIVIVSLLEPLYQAVNMYDPHRYSPGTVAFVFVHVWLVNLSGLWFLRKYDFISMYTFRLFYYLCWHVIWGYLRLGLLF